MSPADDLFPRRELVIAPACFWNPSFRSAVNGAGSFFNGGGGASASAHSSAQRAKYVFRVEVGEARGKPVPVVAAAGAGRLWSRWGPIARFWNCPGARVASEPCRVQLRPVRVEGGVGTMDASEHEEHLTMCDYSLRDRCVPRPEKVRGWYSLSGGSTVSRGVLRRVGEPGVAVCLLPGAEARLRAGVAEYGHAPRTPVAQGFGFGKLAREGGPVPTRSIKVRDASHHDALEFPDKQGRVADASSSKPTGDCAAIAKYRVRAAATDGVEHENQPAVIGSYQADARTFIGMLSGAGTRRSTWRSNETR